MTIETSQLALHGGPKAKATPYGTGQRFGDAERRLLDEALSQNTLFCFSGKMVKRLENEFAEMIGAKYAVASTSGTASIHVALGALGIGPGDEVITTPITDQGTVVGPLFQGAKVLFADLEPYTYQPDPNSVAALITPRTRAIVVVQLAGATANMDRLREIAQRTGVPLVEDCAQSFLAEYDGRYAGTMGALGCFSLNDHKHISVGDGGLTVTDDLDLARAARRFTDKWYQREKDLNREVDRLAPNYRMSELCGAVGVAQLGKLRWICSRRRELGNRLTSLIEGLPGIHPHQIVPKGKSSYWFYMLRVDESVIGCDRNTFAQALRAEGLSAGAGYIEKPVYLTELFTRMGRPYVPGLCPVAEEILTTAIRLPINEFHTDQDIEETGVAIRKVALYYAGQKR